MSLLRQILHCLTLHFCGITVISILLKHSVKILYSIPLNIIEVDKIIRRVLFILITSDNISDYVIPISLDWRSRYFPISLIEATNYLSLTLTII